LGLIVTWNEEELARSFDVNAIALIRLAQACILARSIRRPDQ
jgi:hypothetical protein